MSPELSVVGGGLLSPDVNNPDPPEAASQQTPPSLSKAAPGVGDPQGSTPNVRDDTGGVK